MSEVFSEAAKYISDFSWPIVKNYGMTNGVCMCSQGVDCGTPGKHPVHGNWMPHATKDEDVVASWFENGEEWNIGVPLGATSGIVDTEWDDEEAFDTAKKYGLVDAKTPGFRSSRGSHRLWLLDARLVSIPKAVQKIGGLEVRFGGGGKQSQSIFPPSTHHSGVPYSWEAGRSPWEVELAKMPEALVLATISACGGRGEEPKITKNTIFERIVRCGERHEAMVSWISSEIMRMRDPHDPPEQQNVLLMMRSLNKTQMEKPLDDKEIRSIWMSQLRWGMKARAAGAENVSSTDKDAEKKVEEARQGNVHAASGLEWRSGEWFPGMWQLTVVHADPKEFRLAVPVVACSDGGADADHINVSLNSADWSSPISVARKILEATGTIDVTDPNPKEWAKIWNGYSYKKEGEKKWTKVRGLKVKLMDAKLEEWPPVEQQRFTVVAGWLLDALINTAPPDPDAEESEPHPSGKPSWVRNSSGTYELMFSWTRVFEDIRKIRKAVISQTDEVSLRRRILSASGEKEFRVARVKTATGIRRRFTVWSQDHIQLLENIAHPESSQPELAAV